MNPLRILLQEVRPKLVAALTQGAQFSAGQAEAFVPAAAESALDFIREHADQVDLNDLPSLANRLARGLDAKELARRVGVTPSEAQNGLETVLPELLAAAEKKARPFGGLAAVAKLLGGGAGTPSLGGIASKLFGR